MRVKTEVSVRFGDARARRRQESALRIVRVGGVHHDVGVHEQLHLRSQGGVFTWCTRFIQEKFLLDAQRQDAEVTCPNSGETFEPVKECPKPALLGLVSTRLPLDSVFELYSLIVTILALIESFPQAPVSLLRTIDLDRQEP